MRVASHYGTQRRRHNVQTNLMSGHLHALKESRTTLTLTRHRLLYTASSLRPGRVTLTECTQQTYSIVYLDYNSAATLQ